MHRRSFLLSVFAVVFFSQRSSLAQSSSFAALLKEYQDTPGLLENAWLFRERGVSRGVGTGTPSSRKISQQAIDLIVQLEIGNRKRYEARYTRPIWPKGQSGITMGIGYDLRFATRALLYRDWGDLVDHDVLRVLEPVLRLGGQKAKQALPSVQSVVIPWDPAISQFLHFLPYPTADAESIFPNSALLSDDSFGALVSLVYNRGKAIPRNSPSREEMVAIHDLMAAKQFDAIPEQIRKMQRLWTTPDSRGLVIRRELEAQLFEAGLR